MIDSVDGFRAVEQDSSLCRDPEAARDDPAALRPLQAGLGRPVRRGHDQPGRTGHGRLHHLSGMHGSLGTVQAAVPGSYQRTGRVHGAISILMNLKIL